MRGWLLLVGDWHRAEFAAAQQWLASRRLVLVCPTVAAACRRLSDPRSAETAGLGPPSAIVLAQSWPGQIDHRQIYQLHAAAPLARLVGLVGPWSEGCRRGDQIWPGVEAVPWHAWRWRLPAAVDLSPDAGGMPELPKTATGQERIAHRIAASRQLVRERRLVAVVSLNPLRAEGLAAMVAALAGQAMVVPGGQPAPDEAGVVLVDGWEAADASKPPASLRRRRKPPIGGPHTEAVGSSALGADVVQRSGVPYFLLLPFPRWEDVVRAETLGFAEVLGQPLLLADLAAALAAHGEPPSRSEPCGDLPASAVPAA